MDANWELISMRINEDVYCYDDYLKSKYWENKRIGISLRKEALCVRCKAVHGDFYGGRYKHSIKQTKLQLHHWTYERLGFELDDDVDFLCDDCHRLFHYRREFFLDDITVEDLYNYLASRIDKYQISLQKCI